MLTLSREVADYFETVARTSGNSKAASNWVMNEVLGKLKEDDRPLAECKVLPESLAALIELIEGGTISGKIAKDVFETMWATGQAATAIVEREGLVQVSDEGALEAAVAEVLAASAPQVATYRSGQDQLVRVVRGPGHEEDRGQGQPRSGERPPQEGARSLLVGSAPRNIRERRAYVFGEASCREPPIAVVQRRSDHEPMKLHLTHAAALLALSTAAFAQPADPRGSTSVSIDGKKVSIDYGRPALKGRSLDELTKGLPADRIWRAGENQVTTLTTETDLVIGGKTVPAGKYSVYVHAPATGDWSLVVNSDLGIPLVKIWDKAPDNMKNEPWPHLEGYSNVLAKEVARAPMKSGKVVPAVDAFTIGLVPKGAGASLTMAWGDRSWALDLTAAKK